MHMHIQSDATPTQNKEHKQTQSHLKINAKPTKHIPAHEQQVKLNKTQHTHKQQQHSKLTATQHN